MALNTTLEFWRKALVFLAAANAKAALGTLVSGVSQAERQSALQSATAALRSLVGTITLRNHAGLPAVPIRCSKAAALCRATPRKELTHICPPANFESREAEKAFHASLFLAADLAARGEYAASLRKTSLKHRLFLAQTLEYATGIFQANLPGDAGAKCFGRGRITEEHAHELCYSAVETLRSIT